MIDRSRDAENLTIEGLVIPHPEKRTARKEKMKISISRAGQPSFWRFWLFFTMPIVNDPSSAAVATDDFAQHNTSAYVLFRNFEQMPLLKTEAH